MISRKVAERIGGQIRYRPLEEGGSCFSLRFPIEKLESSISQLISVSSTSDDELSRPEPKKRQK